MPELPDIAIYVERLRDLFASQVLERIELRSPFVLRTVQPDLFSAEGRTIVDFHRHAKRIVWELEGELWLVFHLMIAGRFHQKDTRTRPRGKNDLAAFHFPRSTLMLTEASKKRRAAIYCFADAREIDRLDRGGIEPLACTIEEFRAALVGENHTLKRSLTDPRLFSGIGNAYSDEILHAARLSPIKLTSKLTDDEIVRLHSATRVTLVHWIGVLRKHVGDGFPENTTKGYECACFR